MTNNLKTSQSHPLTIDILKVNPEGGRVGMTLCPGKYHPSAATGAWERDLDTDLQAIVDTGATTLISLLEPLEFELLRVTELPGKVLGLGLEHYSLAIPDGGVPGSEFESIWERAGREIRDRISNGELVVIHCKGGLGRTGLLAARLCVELGEAPELAIRKVRKVRPGAIETNGQEDHVSRVKPVTD